MAADPAQSMIQIGRDALTALEHAQPGPSTGPGFCVPDRVTSQNAPQHASLGDPAWPDDEQDRVGRDANSHHETMPVGRAAEEHRVWPDDLVLPFATNVRSNKEPVTTPVATGL